MIVRRWVTRQGCYHLFFFSASFAKEVLQSEFRAKDVPCEVFNYGKDILFGRPARRRDPSTMYSQCVFLQAERCLHTFFIAIFIPFLVVSTDEHTPNGDGSQCCSGSSMVGRRQNKTRNEEQTTTESDLLTATAVAKTKNVVVNKARIIIRRKGE